MEPNTENTVDTAPEPTRKSRSRFKGEPLTLSAEEFGARIGISKDGARSLIKQKIIKAMKVGQRWVIPRTEVARFMAELEEAENAPFAKFTGQPHPGK